MNLAFLRKRAELLEATRSFFRGEGFLEVETPVLSLEAIPERNIHLHRLDDGRRYLQASPEMHHKRLLCAGTGPIFEVARVFRGQEWGKRHNPEFTMLEWYRPGDDMRAGVDLLDTFVQFALDAEPAMRTSYRDLFWKHCGVDPISTSVAALRETTERLLWRGHSPEGMDVDSFDRDDWLNMLLAVRIEPRLGRDAPEIIYHYPASQAALAATTTDALGVEVAERFELYYRGVELANGYHELTDADELRRRLVKANEHRVAQGGDALPLPERLLAEMASPGLPPCAGVALGFDRLVMLATGAENIGEVTAFSEFFD